MHFGWCHALTSARNDSSATLPFILRPVQHGAKAQFVAGAAYYFFLRSGGSRAIPLGSPAAVKFFDLQQFEQFDLFATGVCCAEQHVVVHKHTHAAAQAQHMQRTVP